MRPVDEMINEAMDAEERELLRRIGEEPGYLQQAIGIFEGRTGWVNLVLMIAQGAAFVVGAWAAWKFFNTNDILTALRWGLPAATLLLMSLVMKMALWPTIQANRVIRELKRLELQMVSRQPR